ncbi:hypothetical protein PENTCL1PPCAC_22282, partial [Pristionchus entomophagus]
QSPLLFIGEWKIKTCKFAIQSDDSFISVISKGFDVMTAIHNGSDHSCIKRTLDALDIELSFYRRSNKSKEPSIQSLMYGFMESLRQTFVLSPTLMTIPRSTPSLFPNDPKEEPVDGSDMIPNYHQLSALYFVGDEKDIKEEEMLDIDDDVNSRMADSVLDFLGDEITFNEEINMASLVDILEEEKKDERIDHTVDNQNDCCGTIEEEKKRRPSRNASRPAKYIEYFEEGVCEPSMKISRNDFVKKRSNFKSSVPSGRIASRLSSKKKEDHVRKKKPAKNRYRMRNDSDKVKKVVEMRKIEEEGETKKNMDKSQNESGELKKGKGKKPWPIMDYSLPSERNKPSREERKLQAELERFAKSEERLAKKGTKAKRVRMKDTVAGDIPFNDQPLNDDILNEPSHKDSSEIVDLEKKNQNKRGTSRIATKLHKCGESIEYSQGEEELLVKESRSESAKNDGKKIGGKGDAVAGGISFNEEPWNDEFLNGLSHNNGLYLICSCGTEVRSQKIAPCHSKKCDGKKFTLHKLDD